MAASKDPYVVVLGIDYSETSQLAFDAALRAASQHAASELHVVHVASLLVRHARAGEERLATDSDALARALRHLERFVTAELALQRRQQGSAAGGPFNKVISHIRSQAPGPQIAQLAADLNADLVVIGKQGSDGAAHLLLGSVAHQVVVLAPCPVLVVRAKRLAKAVPVIDAPCARCAQARKRSGRRDLWCEEHRARHGQRRTYEQGPAAPVPAEDRLRRRALERWENEGGAASPSPVPASTSGKATLVRQSTKRKSTKK